MTYFDSDEGTERVLNDVWDKTVNCLKLNNSDISGNVLYQESISWEIQIDYSTRDDGQPVYKGYATAGTATSATGWIVQKYTYNINGYQTRRQVATGIWDDRATLFT